jgi:hypothetical protein
MCRFLLLLLLIHAAFSASIHGVVKDPPGAAVNGATIELREVPGDCVA